MIRQAAGKEAEIVAAPARTGGWRWRVCALLFFATTINYLDRQILGILAPTLQKEVGWTETGYGDIVLAFQAAYAAGLLGFGWLMDRLGTRRGYALSVGAWSLAAMAHALAATPAGFGAARFALGLGEAGNFPAALKAVAEWFPRRERALATGVFNAGSNVGAVVAPLVVPALALSLGWRWAFVLTGAVGFVWLAFWLALYRRPEEHAGVSPAEAAHIRSDPPEAEGRLPWARLLPHRQTWAFAAAKALTDPVWWFYLYWFAKFLDKNHGISLSKVSLPLIVVYLVADFGSVGGGWLSSRIIRAGRGVNFGRKAAMLVCALCVLPVAWAGRTDSLWVAVALVALAAAAHQGWSANLFTLASDMFPRRAVGSVVGIGGTAGALGGMAFAAAAGRWLQASGGNYLPVYALCGGAYLLALAVIQLLAPGLKAPNVGESEGGPTTGRKVVPDAVP